jgi:hypothetical protein
MKAPHPDSDASRAAVVAATTHTLSNPRGAAAARPQFGDDPTLCVVLMQTTNADALGVGASTRLPPHAGDGGGCNHSPTVCVGAPLTYSWGGGGGRRAWKCPPSVRGHWSEG